MKISKDNFEKIKKINTSILDKQGREICNPVPAIFSSDLQRPPSLMDQIKRCLKTELDINAQNEGIESFEEADDFDVPDDWDVDAVSQYELTELQEEYFEPDPPKVPDDPPEPPVTDPDPPSGPPGTP